VDGLIRSRPTKAAAAMPPTRVANARREISLVSLFDTVLPPLDRRLAELKFGPTTD
jgi:hypothetical protein